MLTKLEPEFTFAGFTFPRYIPELRRSKYDKRTSRSVYYHAPRPEQAGRGKGFYLDDSQRWEWADEIDGARIDHAGWYTDEHGISDTIRGIVVLLPHGRYLAGWSMGKGTASEVAGDLYTDKVDAARAADEEAESAAEAEREYQEEQDRLQDEEEANQGADEEETEGY